MAWSNVGSLKGPKGDDGDASGGIPQGAIILAYNASPAYQALRGNSAWIQSGNFTATISEPAYDAGGNPTPNDTSSGTRRLILFAKT